MVPSILCEGMLMTQGASKNLGGNKWISNYFVLDENFNLCYFRHDKLRGQVVISHDTVVKLSDKKAHSFEIKTPYVTFLAHAKNDRERDDWLIALQGVIQTANSEKRSEKYRMMRTKAKELQETKSTGLGTHIFHTNGQAFEVDERYEFKRRVGEGAYGVVVAARDKTTEREVAIKKIKGVFENTIDSKRILREIRIMKFLQHKNISSVLDLMRPSEISSTEFNDVYIVMPLMDTDLHRVIYSPQKLSDQHVQYLLYQLLNAVNYMQSAKIIHRDLKPPNILVNAACELRICDFGLARSLTEELNNDPTIYVVTRWYRAPELLCNCNRYTSAIDMWSVGCILAELLGREALFPGNDYLEQIEMLVNVLGSPSDSDLDSLKDDPPGDEEEPVVRYLKDLAPREKVPWREVRQLSKASEDSLDLLDKILTFDATRRLTPAQALEHPYLAAYKSQPLDTCDREFSETDDINESVDATSATMREAIMREIQQFRQYPE